MEFDLTIQEAISLTFIIIGTLFSMIAALGILRMPDLFLRMSMSTKAATLGIGSILLGCIVHFIHDVEVTTRLAATLIFLLLTAPISAHMIGRAGYLDVDTKTWEGTNPDDLKDYYPVRSSTLQSLMDNPNAQTIDVQKLEEIDPEIVRKALSDGN